MLTTYSTLKIEYSKCPPECRLCEEACAREKGGNVLGLSRIKPIHVPQFKFNSTLTCNQCSQPRCLAVCPTGAIDKSQLDGTVRIDESKCVGCGLCTVGCSYGGIYFDWQAHRSFKCDQCNGDPKCVAACPHQVITYINNRPILSYVEREDMMVHGVGACRGCLAELAMRFTLKILGRKTVLFTGPGCAISFVTASGPQAHVRVAQYICLLASTAASMSGIYHYYRRIGRDDVNLVAFVGDGATVDQGMQSLSAAAERRERVIYICNDNEGYMNTGVQRSGSTPFGAETTTTPVGIARRGKRVNSKYFPLLMFFNGAAYVATATIAYPEDYAQKLTRAMQVKDGLSYIHLFLPCPTGWGIAEDRALDAARLAVETNYFPLWEAENGKLSLTYELAKPRPIADYIGLVGKYSHLTPEEISYIQEFVNARYQTIKALATNMVYIV